MQAIILAAGMGKRLGKYTQDNTKCMLSINGVRLIDRMLESLHCLKVNRIILVIGYKGKNVEDYIGNNYKGTPIFYIINPIYDRTNNIYSLFLAKDYLTEDDTILLESDLIFEPQILQKLIDDDYPNIALVDKYESWMDGTVVTLDRDSRVTRFIDKDHFQFEEIKNYYKTVNIYKFSKVFSTNYYVPFLSAYCSALGNNEYYEQVLRVILHLHNSPLKALPLSGESWYEIDDIQDLDIAEGLFSTSEKERYTAITSRFGGYWRYPQMLDFCYLVNPFFPPQRMIDEIKASFETLLQNYPSGMRIISLLAAKYFSVAQEYIVVGNGAAELLKIVLENVTGKVGIIYPTFEEYPNRLSKNQIEAFIAGNNGYRYTAEDLINYFEFKHIRTLVLINPDNPSGNFIPFDGVLALLDWSKKKGIRLIIDESFVDFADSEKAFTLLNNDILKENPHLTVVKSISKAYGVPGLRLGILASGDTRTILDIKDSVSIWNINSFAEFYLQIFEKYHPDYFKACDEFRKERTRFFEELSRIPFLTVVPSQANYFLCEVKDPFSPEDLAIILLKHNIIIKNCCNKFGITSHNAIRIAIRSKQDNTRLIDVLKNIEQDYH